MGQIPLAVSHLPSSTSFYLASLQPLGYKYVARHSDCVGFGINKGEPADFWLIQEKKTYPAGTAHATFPATTREEVGQFVKCALRAGGRVCANQGPLSQPSGGCSASITDLDGNSVEAVYQPNLPTNHRPSPVVKQQERNIERTQSAKEASAPQRSGFSDRGKTIVGTLFGVAAGAMVAYTMMNKSSKTDETVYAKPASQVADDRTPPAFEAPVQAPQRQLAIGDAGVWDEPDSIVNGSRVHTIMSQDQKTESIASAIEGLENSTAAWSIKDDDTTCVSQYSRRSGKIDPLSRRNSEARSIASSTASSYVPTRAPSAFISEFDARTVALNLHGREPENRHRQSRSDAPTSRAPSTTTSRPVDVERKRISVKGPSKDSTVVAPSRIKSILKTSSVAPSKQTSRGYSVMSQSIEATKATHKTHGTECASRSGRSHMSRSHVRSHSHVSRRDRSPVSETSSGEETYHLVSYPVNVAPGKPMPNSTVYVDENGYDSETTATATDMRAASRTSKYYTTRAYRSAQKVHRSHSVAGRSHSRRSRFDEEVLPDDSVSQVC
ncbi:hypothetical protein KEM54_004834 [Ascosphaera aggregata]|nr:hypothetical protein KEM54_004834 [Ascosphaera aggregata]